MAGENDNRGTRLLGAVVQPIQDFFRLEAASGVLLFLAAVVALIWANLAESHYRSFFDHRIILNAGLGVARFTLVEAINDGVMAIFFFLVGMEIKRELAVGELNTPTKAALPAIAALGGMVVPVAIFVAINWGQPGLDGWGIPMATDIAFSIGCLRLLKRRVPHALVVFLTALAIFDDVGGILVIAAFYGHGLSWIWLAGSAAITALLFAMNRRYVRSAAAYAAVGAVLWYAIHRSGIHATISGVILGLMIPARSRRPAREVLTELADQTSDLLRDRVADAGTDNAGILLIEEKVAQLEPPLIHFEHRLHPYVAYLIMPVFALANGGVSLTGLGVADLTGSVAVGAALGLLAGKTLGIFAATVAAVRLGLAPVPGNASFTKLLGVSAVAGIGFTVALFIASLAYGDSPRLLEQSKIGILAGSLLAGVLGCAILRATPAVPPAGG